MNKARADFQYEIGREDEPSVSRTCVAGLSLPHPTGEKVNEWECVATVRGGLHN